MGISLESRFWMKVNKTDTCWLWMGCLAEGYGVFNCVIDGIKHQRAHRVSYVLSGKKLIKNKTLDHLCRVRNCVRPDHLEQVSRKENIIRGFGAGAINHRKTYCKNGHPFDEDNTYYRKYGGRDCRLCKQRRWNKMYKNNKSALSSRKAEVKSFGG